VNFFTLLTLLQLKEADFWCRISVMLMKNFLCNCQGEDNRQVATTSRLLSTSVPIGSAKKTATVRPNYFIAIPICNAEIKQKLQEVQTSITGCNKYLQSALVSIAKTHITLAVLHLKDQEQIDNATQALKSTISKMQNQNVGQMKLNFKGLGHFRDTILFAKILEDDGFTKLYQIAEIVRNTFTESGVTITDDRKFNAHVTVAKLSKDRKLHHLGVKKIDGSYYREFVDTIFGEEDCSKLQLLAMEKMDQATGYYHCVSEATFGLEAVINDDSGISVS